MLWRRRRTRMTKRKLQRRPSYPQMEFDDPNFACTNDAMPDIEDHEEWAYGLGCEST